MTVKIESVSLRDFNILPQLPFFLWICPSGLFLFRINYSTYTLKINNYAIQNNLSSQTWIHIKSL
jgi:hypothetical protein